MPEAPGASDLINTPADKFPVATQEQRSAALATLTKYRANLDARAAYLRGDAAAHAEVKAANETMLTPTRLKVLGKEEPEMMSEMMGSVLAYAGDIPAQVVDQFQRRVPVSAEEQAWARRELSQLKQDEEWVKQLMSGQRSAKSRWTMLHGIISSPTLPEK